MNILFMSQDYSPLIPWLTSKGNSVVWINSKYSSVAWKFLCSGHRFDFGVSYGYRHIIKGFQFPIVNLHISYLPFNRGVSPNFFSFLKGTRKGVSIHWMDEGIDTGDIIVQREVKLEMTDTLTKSYNKLHSEIQELFKENFNNLYNIKPTRQGSGTYNSMKDFDKFKYLLTKGWDTTGIDIYDNLLNDNLKL